MPAFTHPGFPQNSETLFSRMFSKSFFLTSTRGLDALRSMVSPDISGRTKTNSTRKRWRNLPAVTSVLAIFFLLYITGARAMKDPERTPKRQSRKFRKQRSSCGCWNAQQTPSPTRRPKSLQDNATIQSAMSDVMGVNDHYAQQKDLKKHLTTTLKRARDDIKELKETCHKHIQEFLEANPGREKEAMLMAQQEEQMLQLPPGSLNLCDLSSPATIENGGIDRKHVKDINKYIQNHKTRMKEIGEKSVTDTAVTSGIGREWVGDWIDGIMNKLAGVAKLPSGTTILLIDMILYLLKVAPAVMWLVAKEMNSILAETISSGSGPLSNKEIAKQMKANSKKYVTALKNLLDCIREFKSTLEIFLSYRVTDPFSDGDLVIYNEPGAHKGYDNDGIFKTSSLWRDNEKVPPTYLMVHKFRIEKDGKLSVEKQARKNSRNETSQGLKSWWNTLTKFEIQNVWEKHVYDEAHNGIFEVLKKVGFGEVAEELRETSTKCKAQSPFGMILELVPELGRFSELVQIMAEGSDKISVLNALFGCVDLDETTRSAGLGKFLHIIQGGMGVHQSLQNKDLNYAGFMEIMNTVVEQTGNAVLTKHFETLKGMGNVNTADDEKSETSTTLELTQCMDTNSTTMTNMEDDDSTDFDSNSFSTKDLEGQPDELEPDILIKELRRCMENDLLQPQQLKEIEGILSPALTSPEHPAPSKA